MKYVIIETFNIPAYTILKKRTNSDLHMPMKGSSSHVYNKSQANLCTEKKKKNTFVGSETN